LFRNKRGHYQIDLRYREPGTGKLLRHTQRLPLDIKVAAAKRIAREVLNQALAGTLEPRSKSKAPTRLARALDAYLTAYEQRDRGRSTLRDRRYLKAILLRSLGDMPLDKLSGMQARALLKKRKEEGVSNATANRALTTFKHFVGFAGREGWLAFSQEKAIREVKRLSEPPERIRYLTDDEQQRLMAALTPMPKLIVRTALLSGMRLGEILSLKLDQVDFAVGVITLTRTKNNKSRSVPMSEELALVLREAMMRSRAPHVFTSRLGKPYQVQSVSRMFARATKRVGIDNLRFHDLRHDFATRLRRQGVGLDIIGAILGHSSLGVTQRYAHLELETLHAAVRGVG
jgi:integrase